ncbi:MAG: serine hydrolase domain-containing protein [Bacteroidales bacterium]|nr:serine hydrolase domain-containing protein [Bacteroidales bacterium]
MKKILFVVVMLLAVSIVGKAQPQLNSARLDSLFQLLANNDKAMASVCIYHDGNEVYSKSIGYSSVSDRKANSPETRFRIGSISKSFTSVMIMQLLDEGLLKLETPLSDFFPQITNSKSIQIRHLVTHSSGIGSFTDDPEYLNYLTQKKTRKELLDIITAQEEVFKPGEKVSYSNSNFVLLAFIIENLTSSTYDEQLNKRIIKSLDLSRTSGGDKINPQNNEALSYKFDGKAWILESETDMSIPVGAGSVVSTPKDLCQFMTALFDGKLVSDSSLNRMTEAKEKFGIGLMRFPFGNRKAYGHTGGIDGFSSVVSYFPAEKVTVAFTSNGLSMAMNDILIGVLSIYFNEKYDFPDYSKKAVVVDLELLKSYDGIYASAQIPLKLTMAVNDGVLMAQGTGQPAFPLTGISNTEFHFAPAGVVILFDETKPGTKCPGIVLKQGGMEFKFTRE